MAALRRFLISVLWLTGGIVTCSAALAACPAGKECRCSSIASAESVVQNGSWYVVESENFTVYARASAAHAKHLARHAETLRREIQLNLLGQSQANWTPRCQIVLHASRAAYTAAVGRGSEATAGSSAVGTDRGAITSRRIDLMDQSGQFLSAALPHELTHVVLVDRFPDGRLPRWADEGLAIVADDPAKQARHGQDYERARANATLMDLATLLTADTYPAADRQGAFYGQSAALAQFFLSRSSGAKFVEFLAIANAEGYDAALRSCYAIAGVNDLRYCLSIAPDLPTRERG